MESEEESDSGIASLALATAYVAKSILNTEVGKKTTIWVGPPVNRLVPKVI